MSNSGNRDQSSIHPNAIGGVGSSASPIPGANSVADVNLRASSKVSLKSSGAGSKGDPRGGEENSAALLDSDIISLDKFKLDQVGFSR